MLNIIVVKLKEYKFLKASFTATPGNAFDIDSINCLPYKLNTPAKPRFEISPETYLVEALNNMLRF